MATSSSPGPSTPSRSFPVLFSLRSSIGRLSSLGGSDEILKGSFGRSIFDFPSCMERERVQVSYVLNSFTTQNPRPGEARVISLSRSSSLSESDPSTMDTPSGPRRTRVVPNPYQPVQVCMSDETSIATSSERNRSSDRCIPFSLTEKRPT